MSAPYDRFGIDPIGTAGHYRHFVLVEWRLPWPRDIFDDEALDRVKIAVDRAAERDEPTRVLALVPGTGGGTPSGVARIIRYTHNGSIYVRSEALVELDDLVDQVVAVIDGADPSPEHDPGDVRDLLICTHGKRDSRCGSKGLRLFTTIAARWPGVRVWRISHTGGHRFAPTGISFPEGWFWGNLDPEMLDGVINRDGRPAELAHHLRGNAALASSAQLLDRDGFVDEGWSWVSRKRSASVEVDGDQAKVSLTVGRGGKRDRRGVIGVGRQVPTTVCDSACDDASATTPELSLLST